MRRTALAFAAVVLAVSACSGSQPTAVTLVPPTPATDLVPDTGGPESGSGDTTPAEQGDPCTALSRVYFLAIGTEGTAEKLEPLYAAVTPLLPEEVRDDWELAATAFIAYAEAATTATVPEGDELLDVPDVAAAYERATSDEVQDAAQRVRDAMTEACPGILD